MTKPDPVACPSRGVDLDLHDAGQHRGRDAGDAAVRRGRPGGPARHRGWRRRRCRRCRPARPAGSRRRRRHPGDQRDRGGQRDQQAGAAAGRPRLLAEGVGGAPRRRARCPARPPSSSAPGDGSGPSGRLGGVGGRRVPHLPRRCRTTTGGRRSAASSPGRSSGRCLVGHAAVLRWSAGRQCVLSVGCPQRNGLNQEATRSSPRPRRPEGVAVRSRVGAAGPRPPASTVRSGASATTV